MHFWGSTEIAWPLNHVFSSTAVEIEWAEDVVTAAKLASIEGRLVYKVRGQLVD